MSQTTRDRVLMVADAVWREFIEGLVALGLDKEKACKCADRDIEKCIPTIEQEGLYVCGQTSGWVSRHKRKKRESRSQRWRTASKCPT